MTKMTRDELLSLPPTIDLLTAAKILGMGRSKAYEMVRREEFPVPVVKLGNRYRVVTEKLLTALGVTRHESVQVQPPTVRCAHCTDNRTLTVFSYAGGNVEVPCPWCSR